MKLKFNGDCEEYISDLNPLEYKNIAISVIGRIAKCTMSYMCKPYAYTVEPPNNGHIGSGNFVHALLGGCPYLGGSIMGGSTVYMYLY